MIRLLAKIMVLMLVSGALLAVILGTTASSATGAPAKAAPIPEQIRTANAKRDDTGESPKASAPCPGADPAELRLFKALRQRRAQLDERERLVTRREEAVATLELRFQAELDEMAAEVTRLENLYEIGEAGRAARNAKVAGLARTIETLSARKAAPMLARADQALAAALLVRLPPERSGELLTRMEPQRAAELMAMMVKKQEGPTTRPHSDVATRAPNRRNPRRRR